MGLQMFIITQNGEYSLDSSRDLQMFVRQRGGYTLMVTRTGPIILIDDSQAPAVAKHPLVGFIRPVTLNPSGVAAEILQQIFAENLSKQLDLEPHGDAEPA